MSVHVVTSVSRQNDSLHLETVTSWNSIAWSHTENTFVLKGGEKKVSFTQVRSVTVRKGMGLSFSKWLHKLAYVVCIYLDVSGCLRLSVLSEFQVLSVVLGQWPGGQLDAFPGITRSRSSSQRALDHPSWYLLPSSSFLGPLCFCAVGKTASGGTPHIFKSL